MSEGDHFQDCLSKNNIDSLITVVKRLVPQARFYKVTLKDLVPSCCDTNRKKHVLQDM